MNYLFIIEDTCMSNCIAYDAPFAGAPLQGVPWTLALAPTPFKNKQRYGDTKKPHQIWNGYQYVIS